MSTTWITLNQEIQRLEQVTGEQTVSHYYINCFYVP